MDSVQAVRNILRDKARQEKYEAYQQSEVKWKKEMRLRYAIVAALVAMAVFVCFVGGGAEALLSVIPFGIVGLIVGLIWKTIHYKKMNHSWNENVKDTMLEIIRVSFPDAEYFPSTDKKGLLWK